MGEGLPVGERRMFVLLRLSDDGLKPSEDTRALPLRGEEEEVGSGRTLSEQERLLLESSPSTMSLCGDMLPP